MLTVDEIHGLKQQVEDLQKEVEHQIERLSKLNENLNTLWFTLSDVELEERDRYLTEH